jgi:hypothetical protein
MKLLIVFAKTQFHQSLTRAKLSQAHSTVQRPFSLHTGNRHSIHSVAKSDFHAVSIMILQKCILNAQQTQLPPSIRRRSRSARERNAERSAVNVKTTTTTTMRTMRVR